jgi:UDP-N-acetylmuramoyl-tripeptide--D-alanyl-D-alanine ligase
MLELGGETLRAHQEAGRMVAELGVSYFVALGEHAPEMIRGALKGGMPAGATTVAATHEEMARRLKEEMKEGDLVLVKGSRGVGLEKVVELLGAER